MNERDKILIEEREKYEEIFFEHIVDEMIDSEYIDDLIAERFDYIDEHFEFEPSPAYEELERLYYAESDSKFQKQISDVDDYIDYPEGPDENIEGIKRDEFFKEFYDDFDDYRIELYIERELAKQEELENQQMREDYEDYLKAQKPLEDDYENYLKMNEFNPGEAYEDLIQEAVIEDYEEDEKYLDELITQHIQEEKYFVDDIVADSIYDTIIDEAYFERAIDEFIFDHIDIDYEPDFFDYDERDVYWYKHNYNQPDESVVDEFDSFGEIDYPDGEPQFNYEIPHERSYEDEMLNDFVRYQRRKERLFGYSDDELPVPEDELILEPPQEDEKRTQLLIEREKIESKFKDYFKKDDTLSKIVKEKLREKKFKE